MNKRVTVAKPFYPVKCGEEQTFFAVQPGVKLDAARNEADAMLSTARDLLSCIQGGIEPSLDSIFAHAAGVLIDAAIGLRTALPAELN